MKTKQKLSIFKGAPTEAKFDNGMTLELAYSGRYHRYIDAKEIMSELVKCWNLHDELIKENEKLKAHIIVMEKSIELIIKE